MRKDTLRLYSEDGQFLRWINPEEANSLQVMNYYELRGNKERFIGLIFIPEHDRRHGADTDWAVESTSLIPGKYKAEPLQITTLQYQS